LQKLGIFSSGRGPRSVYHAAHAPRQRPGRDHDALKAAVRAEAAPGDLAARWLRGGAAGRSLRQRFYLVRYLNVPPARTPGDGGDLLDDLPANAEAFRAALLDA
jgi:hypothetical protein